jgi:hypothetical protein
VVNSELESPHESNDVGPGGGPADPLRVLSLDVSLDSSGVQLATTMALTTSATPTPSKVRLVRRFFNDSTVDLL